MASEEQQEELEAIQAIFMDDYQNLTKVKFVSLFLVLAHIFSILYCFCSQ